jgi:cell division protein FtsI/penicillin-binding protein 2
VAAIPYLITDPEATARTLAPILSIPPAKLVDRLRGGTYQPLVQNLDLRAAQRLRALDLPGIDIAASQTRVYPQGRLAAQVVGLTGDGGKGISGIEAVENQALTGRPGLRRELRDALGRPVRFLPGRDPVSGQRVRLTIDSGIQSIVGRVLAQNHAEFGSTASMAVVIRPQDGAILAMATAPGFNPNDRRTVSFDDQRNRPVTDSFEPGSVFKLVTISAALQERKVTPDTMLYLPPTYTLYDRTLHEAERSYAVTWSVRQILAESSNIGTVKIAQLLGKDRLQRWIERFGFGHLTGIDYPGEQPGFLRPPSQWYGTGILNIPIGQGDTITALQLARAYAAVANGGLLVTPHLVQDVGTRVASHARPQRILSPGTARTLNQMLRGVVSDTGTGVKATVPGYVVAGKTGTAQKFEHGQYVSRYVASFVGFVPANRPRFVIAVTVDNPTKGSIFGGQVAAPAFEQIAAQSLQHEKIPPSG